MVNKKTGLAYAAETFNELDDIAKEFLTEYYPNLMQEIQKIQDEYETTKSLVLANLSDFVVIDNCIYTPIKVIQACDDRTTVELSNPLVRPNIFRGYENLKRLNLQTLVFILKERDIIPPRETFDYIKSCLIHKNYYETPKGESLRFSRIRDNQFEIHHKISGIIDISEEYIEGDIPLNKPIPIWL